MLVQNGGGSFLGEPDDAPRCYVPGCGAIDGLEPAGFPESDELVCGTCRVSQGHQRALREAFAGEGY